MVSRECTWCKFVKQFYGRDLAEELTAYIESLPAEIRVDDREHEKRLAVCSTCSSNVNGFCRHCGCYVAARTVKKDLSCPHPSGAKWSRVNE